MSIGSYVIANDLLGVVTQLDGNHVQVVDKDGVERRVKKSVCHEIVNPHALALMLYNKVHKNLRGTEFLRRT